MRPTEWIGMFSQYGWALIVGGVVIAATIGLLGMNPYAVALLFILTGMADATLTANR